MPTATLNPLLIATDVPPIPAARGWAARYDGRHGALIDLAQAVPGSPPPPALLDRLAAAARDPGSAAYGPILGDPALREALAADMRTLYGGAVAAEHVAITAGCNQAFFATVMALARAGDEVILPSPWYFNHKMTLDMLGIAARLLPCRAEDGFVPRAAEARRLVGPNTRAIVLVSPNNPTGAVYPAAVLAAFADLARESGLALVLDETYRDFLPNASGRPHDLFAAPDWADTLIHLYSFSKSYAVPGHRLGALVTAPARLAEIGKVLDCLQICAPRAAQDAVAWAVQGTADWRAATRAAVNAQGERFRAVLAEAPGWSVAALGAYFAYLRHPYEVSSEQVAERLAAEAGVLVLPGSFFGPSGDQHLRVAFANVDGDRLDEVGTRLARLG